MSVNYLERLRRLLTQSLSFGYRQWLFMGGLVVLLLVCLSLWSWQQKQYQRWEQALKQWTQLQTLLLSMPSQLPVVTDASAMMAVVRQTPLPSVLQGQLSDIRQRGEQLIAEVQGASAGDLFFWLSELERQGVLVSQASLKQTEPGRVSGTLILGQP